MPCGNRSAFLDREKEGRSAGKPVIAPFRRTVKKLD